MQKVIRFEAVIQATSLSRSTIYNKTNPASRHYDADFPKPFKLGERSIGWLNEDVQAWIEKIGGVKC